MADGPEKLMRAELDVALRRGIYLNEEAEELRVKRDALLAKAREMEDTADRLQLAICAISGASTSERSVDAALNQRRAELREDM